MLICGRRLQNGALVVKLNRKIGKLQTEKYGLIKDIGKLMDVENDLCCGNSVL